MGDAPLRTALPYILLKGGASSSLPHARPLQPAGITVEGEGTEGLILRHDTVLVEAHLSVSYNTSSSQLLLTWPRPCHASGPLVSWSKESGVQKADDIRQLTTAPGHRLLTCPEGTQRSQ